MMKEYSSERARERWGRGWGRDPIPIPQCDVTKIQISMCKNPYHFAIAVRGARRNFKIFQKSAYLYLYLYHTHRASVFFSWFLVNK